MNASSVTISRGITLSRFEKIRDVYGSAASWAIWDKPDSLNKTGIGNLDVLDPEKNPELLSTLHTNLVLVGLNGSRTMEGNDCLSNFHDKSTKGQDYKLRHAAYGTALWGAYMTDIIKSVQTTSSNSLTKQLKADPRQEEENVELFRRELAEIGAASPILVPMGGEAARIVKNSFRGEHRIIPIMHYSHYVSIDNYCLSVWSAFPRS
jgi:hypothetical protein